MLTTDLELTVSSDGTKPIEKAPPHHVGKVEGSGNSTKLPKLYAPPYCMTGWDGCLRSMKHPWLQVVRGTATHCTSGRS